VGNSLNNSFETVAHLVPMLSLENSYNAEDLNDFHRKACEGALLDSITYCVEPKFDGASISLIYENDLLVRACTRGDGVAGEDITQNIKQIKSIPLSIPMLALGIQQMEIRGEVIMSKKSFDDYNEKLKANNIEKVNLVFSTSIRGHAKEISKEIVLPRLGDWRFGYKDVYSAELVFHEFSHLLDYGRVKVQKYGKTDIHKHDFVRILDKMLEMYSKFIEGKYIPSRQREQILNNSNLLVDFHINREEIEAQDKEQELKQLAEKKQEMKNILSEAGVSEDNFPIHLLLQEERENKLNYLEFAIANYEKSTPVSLPLKENIKLLRENLSSEKSNLNKVQINLLISALDKSKLNDYLIKLPLMLQLKSASILRKFSDEVRELSRGKISSLEVKDSFKIRTYEEAERLKKRGAED
jgi:hypothetical protein